MKQAVYTSILLSTLLVANDSMDNLLGEFAQKSDLSKETKLKNAGHTIIFTRSDIERMQARNLKDIIKSTPFFSVLDSKAGYLNLNLMDQKVPFSNSQVRIYLDNHEITSGIYGSIFSYMSAIELEFVDHIELYLAMPSFEYSTESTQVLIKLHTKVPQRDSGGKLLLSSGSFGGNQQSGYFAKDLGELSYFAYISRLEDNRDNPTSNGQEVSKDKRTEHFVGTIFNKEHHLLVNAMQIKQDLFANISLDATSTKNDVKYKNLQVSYQNKSFENILTKVAYQRATDILETADNVPFYCEKDTAVPILGYRCTSRFAMTTIENVGTLQTDYFNKIGANDFLIGATARSKNVDFEKYESNNGNLPKEGFDTQNIYSAYLQNEFSISDNSILATGAKYSKINNNANIKDQSLIMYRVGYTFNKDNLTAKLFYYENPSPLEPYLHSSYFALNKNLKEEVMKSYVAEVDYTLDKHNFRLLTAKYKTENALYYNTTYSTIEVPITYTPPIYFTTLPSSSIDNYKENIYNKRFMLDYSFNYSSLHTLKLNYFKQFIENSPSGDYNEMGGYARFLNTFGKFDIFNEVIYREDTLENKDWYDYSAGIKYRYSKDLAFSVKGENILDKARKQSYSRISTETYTSLPPIEATSVDKKYYVSMEYSF